MISYCLRPHTSHAAALVLGAVSVHISGSAHLENLCRGSLFALGTNRCSSSTAVDPHSATCSQQIPSSCFVERHASTIIISSSQAGAPVSPTQQQQAWRRYPAAIERPQQHQQQQQCWRQRQYPATFQVLHQGSSGSMRRSIPAAGAAAARRCLHTGVPTGRKWLPEFDAPDPADEWDEEEVLLDEDEALETAEGEEFDSEWVDGGVINTHHAASEEDEYDVEFDEAWEGEEELDDLKDEDEGSDNS